MNRFFASRLPKIWQILFLLWPGWACTPPDPGYVISDVYGNWICSDSEYTLLLEKQGEINWAYLQRICRQPLCEGDSYQPGTTTFSTVDNRVLFNEWVGGPQEEKEFLFEDLRPFLLLESVTSIDRAYYKIPYSCRTQANCPGGTVCYIGTDQCVLDAKNFLCDPVGCDESSSTVNCPGTCPTGFFCQQGQCLEKYGLTGDFCDAERFLCAAPLQCVPVESDGVDEFGTIVRGNCYEP